MILNNYHDKKYIELTDKDIIFHKWYGKRVLNLDKIRGAMMFDDYIIRILYGNTVKLYNVCNIKNTDKKLVGEVIEKINKDDMIFSYQVKPNPFAVITAFMPVIVVNMLDNNIFFNIMLLIVGAIILWGLMKYNNNKHPGYDILIYNYKDSVIQLENIMSKKTRKININEDKINIKYKDNQYVVSINKANNFSIQSNVIYPTNYKSIIHKLYEVN